jgi:hypothetical protein
MPSGLGRDIRFFFGIAFAAMGSVLSVSALLLLAEPKSSLVVNGVAMQALGAKLEYALYAFALLAFGLYLLHAERGWLKRKLAVCARSVRALLDRGGQRSG